MQVQFSNPVIKQIPAENSIYDKFYKVYEGLSGYPLLDKTYSNGLTSWTDKEESEKVKGPKSSRQRVEEPQQQPPPACCPPWLPGCDALVAACCGPIFMPFALKETKIKN